MIGRQAITFTCLPPPSIINRTLLSSSVLALYPSIRHVSHSLLLVAKQISWLKTKHGIIHIWNIYLPFGMMVTFFSVMHRLKSDSTLSFHDFEDVFLAIKGLHSLSCVSGISGNGGQ